MENLNEAITTNKVDSFCFPRKLTSKSERFRTYKNSVHSRPPTIT